MSSSETRNEMAAVQYLYFVNAMHESIRFSPHAVHACDGRPYHRTGDTFWTKMELERSRNA